MNEIFVKPLYDIEIFEKDSNGGTKSKYTADNYHLNGNIFTMNLIEDDWQYKSLLILNMDDISSISIIKTTFMGLDDEVTTEEETRIEKIKNFIKNSIYGD